MGLVKVVNGSEPTATGTDEAWSKAWLSCETKPLEGAACGC
jgi:hypothetical protein